MQEFPDVLVFRELNAQIAAFGLGTASRLRTDRPTFTFCVWSRLINLDFHGETSFHTQPPTDSIIYSVE